jgi:ubiquinone/menaquinone biosynthesis C-methylase UbiE
VQEDIFIESEADLYFERNKSSLSRVREHLKWMLNELQPFEDEINYVAEIGCASGINLDFICSNLNAQGTGIDPSKLAIETAKKKFSDKELRFHIGTADKLEMKSSAFDLVYVGFCLYLVSEERISQAIDEILRVIKPGGFIVVTDFDFGQFIAVPYSHDGRVTTFKRDYYKILQGKGVEIFLVSKMSFSHSADNFNPDRNERISTCIFYVEK